MNDRYVQIRYMAANYSRLQGLRTLPIGMLLIYVSIWSLYNQGSTADLGTPILVAIAAALLYWITDRYYNHVFGQVKPSSGNRKWEFIVSVILGVLAFLAFVLDTARFLPISVLGLVFAVCFLEYLWRTDRSEWKKVFLFFPENVVAAAVLTIISLLPLIGISVWEAIGIQWQLVGVLMTVGIVIIITGVWGHIRMTRTLSTGEARSNDVTL
jgi:hypothetical protein